ncbi:MAG: hypothetical protein ACLFP8_02745 [Alphaproteobacteria bacterium]
MIHLFFLLIAIFISLMSMTTSAYAYIGPAIALLGSLFGPVIALVAVIILTLFFPILKLYKTLAARAKSKEDQETHSE